jgi:hypothetical protein
MTTKRKPVEAWAVEYEEEDGSISVGEALHLTRAFADQEMNTWGGVRLVHLIEADTPELRAQRAELKKARVLLERCVQELIRLGDPSEDAEPSPLQIEIERYLKAKKGSR